MDKDNFNANVDFVRGQADMIVLSALSDNDKYGLEILNSIQDKSKGLYTLKQATLYNSLKRLEKNGLVHSYDGDVSNGAKRVYYGLTEQGRQALENDRKYWEFSNFLMSNLVSDNKFDPASNDRPFDPTEFRPLTRRSKAEKSEKEVIIKYIEVVRTPEEIKQLQESGKMPQYVNCEKPVGEDAILQEVQNPQIIESYPAQAVQNFESNSNESTAEDYSEEEYSNNYSSYTDNNQQVINENYSNSNIESNHIESTFVSNLDDSQLTNDASQLDNNQQDHENLIDYIPNNEYAKENIENKIDNQGFMQNNINPDSQNAYPQQNITNATNDYNSFNQYYNQSQTGWITNEPAYNQQDAPSPLYQSNNYFDENNEVSYVSSFGDLFKIQEEEPVQISNEYDYMSMNEMVFKYQAKGITIKPYSKKNTMEFYINRYYFSNKLHLHTALIMFCLITVEILLAHFICNRTNPISNLWLFSILIVMAYPLVRLIMYIVEPNKKMLANFNPKTALLISILPVITLPIVIALLGFVQFGANISDYTSMERSIILPCVLLFNIPCYFLVFAMLYRSNKYHVN